MSDREVLVVVGAIALLVVAVGAMAGLHERHYRSRAELIRRARGGKIEDRIDAIEAILSEDRLV